MTIRRAVLSVAVVAAVVATVAVVRSRRDDLLDASVAPPFRIEAGDEQRAIIRRGILQSGGQCGYIEKTSLAWTDQRTGEQLWYITCRGGRRYAVTLNGSFTAAIECRALEKMGGKCGIM